MVGGRSAKVRRRLGDECRLFALSPEGAHVTYKCTGVYDPKTEYGIDVFDKDIGVEWPITDPEKIIVSERDCQHPGLRSLRDALKG
uniref:dTDP-4-dehydrorhamnose 3,5-epimerase n=1 Tax=Bursaphelenchus xylophilus TaxID=6326 RepID=A0A1I7RTX7_BURXY